MKKLRKLSVAIMMTFAVSLFQLPMSPTFALDTTTTPAGVNVTSTSTTGSGVNLGILRNLKAPTSMESNMSIKLQLKGENLSKEEAKTMEQLSPLLNNLVINLETKTTGNVEKTISDTYAKVSTTIMGLALNIDMWIKYDLTSATPKFKLIIKLPKDLPILPSGKEYMVLDSADMTTADSKTPSMSISSMTEMTKQLQNIIFSICDDINAKFKLVSDKGETSIKTPSGEQSAHKFELRLDDKSFKEVLSYTVNTVLTNKEYMNMFAELMKSISADLKDLKLPSDKEITEAVAEFNGFFDKLKDVKVIGEKGIVYSYAVSPENYLISQNGLFDFVFDIKALDKVFGDTTPLLGGNLPLDTKAAASATGRYLLTLEFSNVNFNINKEMKLDYPVLTKANSTTIAELTGTMMNLGGADTGITLPKTPATVKKPVVTKKPVIKKPVVTKKPVIKKPVVKKPVVKKSK